MPLRPVVLSGPMPGISFVALRVGCLLLGLGIGLLFSFFVLTYCNSHSAESISWDMKSILQGGSVLGFGGLGLIVSFLIERRVDKRDK